MTDQATPRPWHVGAGSRAVRDSVTLRGGPNDTPIAEMWWNGYDHHANAALILRAVNGFDALVEALESIRDFPREGYGRRTEDGYPMEMVYDQFAYERLVDSYRKVAAAALALALGEVVP